MMKTAYRTFLNLLLATSMAVTPVSVVLAAMGSGNEQPAQSAAAEPCHQSGHEQTAGTPEKVPMMAPCGCCGDNYSCADDSACHHGMDSPVHALPIDSTANRDMAPRLLITALPCVYNSLRCPPDTPPPNT